MCYRLISCSVAGTSQAPEKVIVTDLFYLKGMDVGSVNVPYLLARYLLFAAGRKSGAYISGGQFVALLAEHFGLLTMEILGGLTVIAPKLPIIDMTELAPQQPPPPPPATSTMPQRMARLEEDVHEIRGALTKHREVIDAMAHDLSRFCTWTTTSLARMMDREGVSYMSYSQTLGEYQRCVRCRTDGVSTSTAQQDQ
ncbi:hypothetical protein Tco_1565753 [Tanacetum coccineum]